MSLILCAESADINPALARGKGAPCVYLVWGPVNLPAAGVADGTALPANWEMVDLAHTAPSVEGMSRAQLIVTALPPAAWQEPHGVFAAQYLRSAGLTRATLLLLGPAVEAAGAWRADGLPGLDLIPNTLVLPNVQAAPDLRQVLADLAARQARLLALDGPACVEYDPHTDSVTASGEGSVLLAAFAPNDAGIQPSARIHILTAGMTSGWPA